MGSDSRRLFLFMALALAAMWLWTSLIAPKQVPQGPMPAGGRPDGGTAEAVAPAASAAAAPAVVQPARPSEPEKTVTLQGKEFTAVLSTWGGALKSFTLKEPRFSREEKSGARVPMDLVEVEDGQAYPLSLAVLPEGKSADVAGSALRTPMRIAAQDDRSVVFEGNLGPFVVTKRYVVTGKEYELGLEVSAKRRSEGAAAGQSMALVYGGFLPPGTPEPGFFSGGQATETLGAACRSGDQTVRFDKRSKEALEQPPGAVGWAGLAQNYFASVVIPGSVEGTCVLAKGPRLGELVAAVLLPAKAEGGTFKLFAGPKKLDLLRSYDRGLDSLVNYGWVTNLFSFFARLLLVIMQWFHQVVGNWGVAIILLTVLVKVILYPLTHKSMQSMQSMKQLQPEVEKLKAKYGDDKEKLNVAVMQLYREHKVNPLGGCLPMLLQMPVWFALYATLQTSVELYHEPFLWIRDLTAMDPYYILPIAMGLSSFITNKLAPQPADSSQAKMMLYVMPVVFTLLMFRLPAGLTLYIFVNNLLSIGQQQILNRKSRVAPAPA